MTPNSSPAIPEVIFFGNGPLADATLATLKPHFKIIFHARSKADLDTVKKLKQDHPAAFGILASFGVIIKTDLLNLFEPTGGIINIHPSLLPKYRGPSPIETAILNGDTEFGVSVMKLAPAMDAGPLYYQTSLHAPENVEKPELYRLLAEAGSNWLIAHLTSLPAPIPQDDTAATYCEKLSTTLSRLDPEHKTASRLLCEIRAFAGWPKSKYDFFEQKDCIVHDAHLATPSDLALLPTDSASAILATKKLPTDSASAILATKKLLALRCADNTYLIIDRVQPAGKKPMDARSFLNGFAR